MDRRASAHPRSGRVRRPGGRRRRRTVRPVEQRPWACGDRDGGSAARCASTDGSSFRRCRRGVRRDHNRRPLARASVLRRPDLRLDWRAIPCCFRSPDSPTAGTSPTLAGSISRLGLDRRLAVRVDNYRAFDSDVWLIVGRQTPSTAPRRTLRGPAIQSCRTGSMRRATPPGCCRTLPRRARRRRRCRGRRLSKSFTFA